jgi:hypothetical protein
LKAGSGKISEILSQKKKKKGGVAGGYWEHGSSGTVLA